MIKRIVRIEFNADEALLLLYWWSQFESESTHDEQDSKKLIDRIVQDCGEQGLIISFSGYRWD